MFKYNAPILILVHCVEERKIENISSFVEIKYFQE